MSINRDEWLAALDQAGYHAVSEDTTDMVTVAEFAKQMELTQQTARAQLARLVSLGLAARGYKRGLRTDGVPVKLLAYRLTPAKKKAAKAR